MYSDTPFLFIDVSEGIEKRKGTSFENQEEAEVINLLKNFVLEKFNEFNSLDKSSG